MLHWFSESCRACTVKMRGSLKSGRLAKTSIGARGAGILCVAEQGLPGATVWLLRERLGKIADAPHLRSSTRNHVAIGTWRRVSICSSFLFSIVVFLSDYAGPSSVAPFYLYLYFPWLFLGDRRRMFEKWLAGAARFSAAPGVESQKSILRPTPLRQARR